MLNFFDMLAECFDLILAFFTTIATLITNFLSGLVTAFRILTDVVTIPVIFTAFVPGIISSAIFIFVALGVIKFIIGR